jgi:glycerophosphoryl diester phosphodiesterase
LPLGCRLLAGAPDADLSARRSPGSALAFAAVDSLRTPIAFAHRGGRAHADDNTIEAFKLALRLGATGLESDVWLTADGEAVLDHDGVVRQGLRRRPIAELRRSELPGHIPTLEELYAAVGTALELSLDVKDAAACDRVIEVAQASGGGALERLWLCHPEIDQLARWRAADASVHLVDSTFLGSMPNGPERCAAELAEAGIDAVNLHHTEWTGGLASLFLRFVVLCFGWDAQHDRVLDSLLDDGLDAVYSDHVDRMVDAMSRAAADPVG